MNPSPSKWLARGVEHEAEKGVLLMPRTGVFVSYSHSDQIWQERLVTHLAVLERQNLIHVWADTRLQIGERWEKQIDDALAACQVAVPWSPRTSWPRSTSSPSRCRHSLSVMRSGRAGRRRWNPGRVPRASGHLRDYARARVEWEADIRSLDDGMVRIVVTPTWAKLIDFETTLPSAVDELARQRDERQRA